MKIVLDPSSCVRSGLEPPTAMSWRQIELAATHFASGGQGRVYEVTRVDGRRRSGYVAKLFHGPVPQGLPAIMAATRAHCAALDLTSIDGLRALPLILFNCTTASGVQCGYLTNHCTGRTFSDILDDSLSDYLLKTSLTSRLALCLSLARAMAALSAMTIVHADLNAQNLLIDLNSSVLGLIDVDGGAVARLAGEPTVLGKWDPGWMAPELLDQYGTSSGAGQLRANAASDTWSLASAMHYLLFGVAPFFFIAERSATSAYLSRNAWPTRTNVVGLPLGNIHFFPHYDRMFTLVPQLHALMRTTFQEGYCDPSRRATAYQWSLALKAMAPDGLGVATSPAATPSHPPRKSGPTVPGIAAPPVTHHPTLPHSARTAGSLVTSHSRWRSPVFALACLVVTAILSSAWKQQSDSSAVSRRERSPLGSLNLSQQSTRDVPEALQLRAEDSVHREDVESPRTRTAIPPGDGRRPPVSVPTAQPDVQALVAPPVLAPAGVHIRGTYPATIAGAGGEYQFTPGETDVFPFPIGVHRVNLRADAVFLREDVLLRVSGHDAAYIQLPDPIEVRITAAPSLCLIDIDGRFVDTTPTTVRLTPGQHTLRFTWPSLGRERTESVTVRPGGDTVLFMSAPSWRF